MLRLKTLGRLSLLRDADRIAVDGGPPFALHCLAVLGLAGDRAVSTDDVVTLILPDRPRADARAQFDALVAALPAWLDGVQPVQQTADGLRLDPAVISCDVRDFEFAAASGAPDQASRLFDGPFLFGVTAPGKSFDRWREREGARLAQIAKWCRDSMRPRRSQAQLTPGAQVGHGGRYRIEREIGTGGAATVYLAHDSRHNRRVAIKVLREDISETISPERFEREIKFVAQLQHPHILPLFDSGEIGPVLYSVMPFVDGETVRQRISRDGKLPLYDAIRIAAEVADALAYAHSHGVVHRDVKPENILLSDGHPLITDFGIAREVDPNATGRTTLPGVVLGTFPYMSPEQATGEADLDGRTDVYALGAVLYEMLTGKPPFAGEPPRQMMTRRLTEVPPRVSKMGVDLPTLVDDVLNRALQPVSGDRATARELADALALAERHLTGEVRARPANRRRPALIATVLVLLALAALFVTKCAGARSASAASATVRADTALLQRLLSAEDARGTGADGVAPLLAGARSADPVIRRVAIRALGRLQQPSLAANISPALGDASPALRIEAANALAQSVAGARRGPEAPAAARAAVREVIRLLTERLTREPDPAAFGVLARSLGRLPVADTSTAREVEGTIVAALTRRPGGPESIGGLSAGPAHDVAEGLYALARSRRQVGDPSPGAIAVLRASARFGADARVRRIGLLGLGAAGSLDSAAVLAASRDADAEVRRLALAGANALSVAQRSLLVGRAFADVAAMVRLDAIRVARTLGNPPDCAPILAATRDGNPHVMLAAIDALAAPCADGPERAKTLQATAASLPVADMPRAAGRGTWHTSAHAIVSLARADPAAAIALLPRFVAHPRFQVRAYAARAAAQLGDAATLLRLAADSNHNVQEAAIAGLAQVRRHDADSTFIAALGSPGYQVVLAASSALGGSTHAAAVPALLDALDRISAERRENSRDARVAVLTRLAGLGHPMDAARIEKYRTDFDTTVAGKAAELVTKWTGRVTRAVPAPLPIRDERLAPVFLSHGLQLRITMDGASGGGTFVVRLFPDEAPATVARLVRLARDGHYDHLTFHRVVPNFVIQGGSPDATEYVGDGPFMRDELGLRSHDRGTLGISTRGRDTGDAQVFVNLVDNPRLDHDYTVFGEVVSGLAVVDGILEGDVIAKVEVLQVR